MPLRVERAAERKKKEQEEQEKELQKGNRFNFKGSYLEEREEEEEK